MHLEQFISSEECSEIQTFHIVVIGCFTHAAHWQQLGVTIILRAIHSGSAIHLLKWLPLPVSLVHYSQ